MAKRADVELRIRSKNLAAKDLSDLNAELDRFVKNQERQADSSVLATKSLRDLNVEQRELSKLSAELSRRQSLIETLIGRQADLNSAKARINGIRQELAELLSMKSKGTFLGDIDKAIRSVKTELATAEKVFEKSATAAGELDAALKAVGVDTTDLASALNQVTASSNRAKAAVIDQTADINRLSRAQEQAAASARKQAEAQRFVQEQGARQGARRADAVSAFGGAGFDEFERQRNAIRRNGAEVARVQGIHDRFGAVLLRNEKYQRALAAQTNAGSTAVQRQGAAARGAAGSMDRYGVATGRAARDTGLLADTGRKSLSVYQRIRGEVLSLVTAYAGLYQAVNIFASAIQIAQQRQASSIQILRANSGNARLAASDQKFLREEAERLGLVYDDLVKNFANFKISAAAAGIGADLIRKGFSQATETVVGAALSAEDADGVFRAFTQILSKNRVQAEELRGQLGDRLSGAVAEFSNALIEAGKIDSFAGLDDYLKAGKGNLDDFFAFLERYAKGSEEAVKKNSQLIFSDINRLKTAYNNFLELVATSGTSDELQKAIKALTDSLKGEEGKKFAQDLASAFTTVVRILQSVIENFETFLTLGKLFLAFQLAKGVVGLSAALVETAASTIRNVTALRDYYKRAVDARAAGKGLTAAMRGLLLVTGPVGIAVGALVGVFFTLRNASKALDDQLQELDKTLEGISNAKTTVELEVASADTNAQLDASIERVKELQQRQRDLSSSGLTRAGALFDSAKEGTLDVEQAISLELAKQQSLRSGLETARLKQLRLAEQERVEDEAIRKQEEAAAKAAGAAPKEDGEAPKTDKQLRGEENSRANASRAVQKEILDLDQQIFDARIDGEARSAEEIQKNYELTIRKIESQIAEKQLDLDRLEQNSRTANEGNLVASDAQLLQLARARVEQLNLALNARAMETATLSDIAAAEKIVNDLIGERDAKIAAINTQVELGLKTEVEGRREALALQREYSTRITETINGLITLLQALPPDLFARLGAGKLIAELETLTRQAQQGKTELQLIGENLGGEFAQGAAQAFGVLAQGIAGFLQGTNSIGDAFKSASDAFRSFLADFLVGIGQAILQAIILKAIMNAISGGSGGYIDAAVGALGGSNHDGGIVGQDGKTRWMPAAALKRAKRFHDGGLPGLKANEVPTILERGEEVLTADDPRHVLNGGAQGGGGGNTTIINTIDSPSVIEAGVPTKAGTKTLVNTIHANRAAFRTALGI